MEEIETKKTNDNQDILNLESQLLRTVWVSEAKEILDFVPQEDLTKTQQKVLQKCVDKEDLTPNQLTELKKVLQKYRGALQKISPREALDNYDEAVKIMTTEEEFIALMQADEQRYLDVNLNVNGKDIAFTFEVLPLNDSRVVEALELNIDLFRDYSADEINTYNKFARGEYITEEEAGIIGEMNKKIMEKQSSKKIQAMDNFLSYQLKIKDSHSTVDERLKFWKYFPFNAKASIFMRVQSMLGMTEESNEKLFPNG